MISHDNLIWNAKKFSKHLNFENSTESSIAYLPFFQAVTQHQMFLSFQIAAKIHIAEPDAAQGGIIKNLYEFPLTFFSSIPRIFEKMMQLSCSGLENVKFIFSETAPISKKTFEYFNSENILIRNIYGATEWGTIFVSKEGQAGNVGKPYECAEVKIIDENSDGEGEVCVRGRSVFMGYLNDFENTKEAIDDERWFHTGDLGTFNNERNLMVTGRVKEIMIMSNGEFITNCYVKIQNKK